jgi:hypothetical protein
MSHWRVCGLVVLLVGGVGCKEKLSPEYLAQYQEQADKVCACAKESKPKYETVNGVGVLSDAERDRSLKRFNACYPGRLQLRLPKGYEGPGNYEERLSEEDQTKLEVLRETETKCYQMAGQ